MRYNLKSTYKAEAAAEQFKKLIERKAFIEIKEIKLKRNLDQNGLYWLWLSALSVETGYDKTDLHHLYRALFIRKDEDNIQKYIRPEIWKIIKSKVDHFDCFPELKNLIDFISFSTANLDEGDFSRYLNKIQEHARGNFAVILLSREDKEFADFYKEYGFR